MSVDYFLTLATDLSGVVVRIFDCTSEDIVYDGKDSDDPLFDIDYDIRSYEVDSYDLYIDRNGKLTLELNITMDEEDEDEDEDD